MLESLRNLGRIDQPAFQRLKTFVQLIVEWNQKFNLTGYRTEREIEERLIGESIEALFALNVKSCAVLDFGSGAGIPGLAWGLCDPTLSVTSVEIRQKKVAFQKEVVRAVGVRNAEIIAGRFPEAVTGRFFDVITTRAIRFSPSLWTDARSLLRTGGRLVRFVAASASPEEGWNRLPISDRSALLIAS